MKNQKSLLMMVVVFMGFIALAYLLSDGPSDQEIADIENQYFKELRLNFEKEKSDLEKREFARKTKLFFSEAATDSLFTFWGPALEISHENWNYAVTKTRRFVDDPQHDKYDAITLFSGELEKLSSRLKSQKWLQEQLKHSFVLREAEYRQTVELLILLKE